MVPYSGSRLFEVFFETEFGNILGVKYTYRLCVCEHGDTVRSLIWGGWQIKRVRAMGLEGLCTSPGAHCHFKKLCIHTSIPVVRAAVVVVVVAVKVRPRHPVLHR
jgi:hypothetical protein